MDLLALSEIVRQASETRDPVQAYALLRKAYFVLGNETLPKYRAEKAKHNFNLHTSNHATTT